MSSEMFEGYAVVEMMGHRKLTGKITPVEGFGGLLRLEIPGIEQPIIIGSGAIFQITPVSEAFATSRADEYLRQSAFYSAEHLLALLPEEKHPALVTETPREIGIDYEVDDDDYDDYDDDDDAFYGQPSRDTTSVRQRAIKSAREFLAGGPESSPIAILDTETTGLNLDVDEPVEIAIIDATGKVLFDKRIKPTISIGPGASAVHGIGMDDLADAPTFAEIHDELMRVLKGRRVVIWNADYDVSMLFNAARAHKLAKPSIDSRCAMHLYARFYGEWNDYRGDYKWQKLDAACDQCGIEAATIPGSLHSALGDAQRTLEILRYMADEPLPDDEAAHEAVEKPSGTDLPF